MGDSFALPLLRGYLDKSAVRQRITRFQKANPPKKFSIRTEEEDRIRVFRLS